MPKKILLVEDDPFLSEIYVVKFQEAGFEISLATDGSNGLEKIKHEQPDLVLLDIVMPNVDGLELLRTIKDDEATSNIPIVILSNLGEQEDIDSIKCCGFSRTSRTRNQNHPKWIFCRFFEQLQTRTHKAKL